MGPAQLLPCPGNLVLAQRGAMGGGAAGLGGRAEPDHRAARDQRGPISRAGRLQRRGDGAMIMPVDAVDPPAVGLEALPHIIGDGQRGGTVDADLVVVEQHHQAVQALVAGQRAGLVADAFHQIAVAGDHPGAVVDQLGTEAGAQLALGNRHADGAGEALAERPGGGLDARRMAQLRMASGARTELAKASRSASMSMPGWPVRWSSA